MRRDILILITSAFVLSAYSQNADFDSYKRIESDKVMNLSTDQIAKIKKMNREVGAKFRAIGQSNLPGYEKGQRKRALAIEHRNAIRKVLSESQLATWEKRYEHKYRNEDLRDSIKDSYETRLDKLESKYEREKERIEDSSASKETKKTQLKKLKNNYKAEKERLKDERDRKIESGYFSK